MIWDSMGDRGRQRHGNQFTIRPMGVAPTARAKKIAGPGGPAADGAKGGVASRSISRVLYGWGLPNVAAIHLGRSSPNASRDLPGRHWPETAYHPYAVLLPAGFALPRSLPSARWALTPPFHPYQPSSDGGGLLSVALSLGSPPPGVTRRRVSVEPGLSSPAAFRLMLERPPDRLARPMWPLWRPKAIAPTIGANQKRR